VNTRGNRWRCRRSDRR